MKPQLKQKAKFQEILASYSPSDLVKQNLSTVDIVLLCGPTSTGKNTIINKLVCTERYESIVSHTTRPLRQNNGVWETDGNPYWFISEEEMLRMLEGGEMLEAAIIHEQQVSGISDKEVHRIANNKHIAINEVEQIGADNIAKYKPDTFIIIVMPPSFEEWIKRIENRGSMTEDEIKQRLSSALLELEWGLQKEGAHIVINDDLEAVINEVEHIVKDRVKPKKDQAKLDLMKDILAKTKQRLEP